MTQAAEVLSDPIVAAVADPVPLDPPVTGDPPVPSKLEELSALAKAEKAAWRSRKAARARELTYTQRSAQAESEHRATRERLQAIENMDPLDYAEQRGLTADQLAQRVVKRGTQEHAVETLAEKVERLERQGLEREKAAREASYETSMRAKEDEFHAFIKSDEAAHPTLAAMPRARVLTLAHELAADAVADAERRGVRGYRIDPRKLAAKLEEQESAIYEARAKGKLADTTKDSTKEASGDAGQGTKAATPRTLTNAGATERGSMPVNFDELSDAEQNKILAQKLREGWRG